MSQRQALSVSSESSSSSSVVPSESSDEDTYEVEKIMDHRVDPKGRRRFLLKWKGYGHEDDTWEKEENLNCPDLINEYMKSVERQQALMVTKGRMIEPPKRVVRAYRDEDDKIVYEVKYSDGRTEDMPSGDLIKLSPPVMIAFLEKVANFAEGRHTEEYLDYQLEI